MTSGGGPCANGDLALHIHGSWMILVDSLTDWRTKRGTRMAGGECGLWMGCGRVFFLR